MKTLAHILVGVAVAINAARGAHAQAETPVGSGFVGARDDAQRRLEESVKALSELRERIASEKIPLARALREAEDALVAARQKLAERQRTLDNRTLDLSKLRNETKARQEQIVYLSTLLGEYLRNFESGLHVTELQRYRARLDELRLAMENDGLTKQEIFKAQADALTLSIDRLEDALGGTRFDGSAVDASGLVRKGAFVMVGPVAIFRSDDGSAVGTAEQRLGSLEPALMTFERPEDTAVASALVSSGAGQFPLDPTRGNAHKVEATQETLIEHIRKGGPVMVPIFVLAGAALLVVLYKWLTMLFVRRPSQKRLREVLTAVGRGDREAAVRAAKSVGGPTGRMLVSGAEHLGEPRELVEEVMYETVLATRLRLQRLLPFVAICASSAPLLGLLGTVTGIMNTFNLITVFGTGDVKTLSSGISEALITTEYGLIVAIPSLLIHAFLSRKAKSIIDEMEKAGVAFINQVSRATSAQNAAMGAATRESAPPELVAQS
jgi:biopolymer transport protein ExbB